MKLSEAIIKGCEGTRKKIRELVAGNKCCALGAAGIGAGIPRNEVIYSRLSREFPILEIRAFHPITGVEDAVEEIIISLNDNHRWPRLSIAEWVANVVEPQFEKEAK